MLDKIAGDIANLFNLFSNAKSPLFAFLVIVLYFLLNLFKHLLGKTTLTLKSDLEEMSKTWDEMRKLREELTKLNDKNRELNKLLDETLDENRKLNDLLRNPDVVQPKIDDSVLPTPPKQIE